MRRPVIHGLSAVVLALLLIMTPVGARADDGPEDPPASEQLPAGLDYLGVAPEATAATALDSNQKVRLRTLVLVDRAGLEVGPKIMRRVIEEYGRIGLVLDVTYRPISLSGTDSEQLMKDARAQLARAHVTGFKLVHVLTGRYLANVGQAYCIGGIRYAKYHWALSISEAGYLESWQRFGKTAFKGGPALVAAHEIGHVLGAHHAHGNCAENADAALASGEATICTVMDTTLYQSQLRFGRTERAVMRGFAIRYGSP